MMNVHSANHTLQELQLQYGTKIRCGIVFSRYSLVKSFAIDLSVSFWLYYMAVKLSRSVSDFRYEVPWIKFWRGSHFEHKTSCFELFPVNLHCWSKLLVGVNVSDFDSRKFGGT